MKHSSKLNTAKLSTNQRVGYWQEQKQNERKTALEVIEMAKELPHLKMKPIKYLLKN